LEIYPLMVPTLVGHAADKPPGPILFNYIVCRFFGDGRLGAKVSGLFMAILAALSVPATYAFIAYFSKSRSAAFLGASFMALSPALILFYPQFDQFYPVLTAGLTILWAQALQKDRPGFAAALGILFGAATFISYLPCVLGVFLVGYTLARLFDQPPVSARRIMVHVGVAIGAFVGFYVVLWLCTGFDPIATVRAAWPQGPLPQQWSTTSGYPTRRLPGTIPWDLYGFALGSGWIGFLMALYYFVGLIFYRSRAAQGARIAWLCLAQFMLVALLGLIQGETERVWIFMMPMLMLPIGLELKNWSVAARLIAFGALLLLTTVICQNIEFLA
jgi:hypothetical protein